MLRLPRVERGTVDVAGAGLLILGRDTEPAAGACLHVGLGIDGAGAHGHHRCRLRLRCVAGFHVPAYNGFRKRAPVGEGGAVIPAPSAYIDPTRTGSWCGQSGVFKCSPGPARVRPHLPHLKCAPGLEIFGALKRGSRLRAERSAISRAPALGGTRPRCRSCEVSQPALLPRAVGQPPSTR